MTDDVFRLRGFPTFWAAVTVSEFGTYVTTIALQVLVVITLGGTATDVGFLSAARWLPYVLLGLIIGALVDRRRRKPILITADAGRAVLLALIPLLWMTGALALPVLAVIVAGVGMLTLFSDSASQSILPRLVPRGRLVAANARLDQSSSVAQTSGPVLAGALVSTIGAPLAVLVDAVSYLFSAVALTRVPVTEPPPVKRPLRGLGREIAEGVRFSYRHRTLTPFAIASHAWFLVNSAVITVFAPFVLLGLGLSAFELGLVLAFAGVGGLIGSSFARRLGQRFGLGRTLVACYLMSALAWAVLAATPLAGGGTIATISVLAVGQLLYGLGLGASNANEMGYRQSVTPDPLQSRVNTTIRSINRGMIVIGAPLGGILADGIGYVPTLWIGVAGYLAVTVFLAVSPAGRVRDADG